MDQVLYDNCEKSYMFIYSAMFDIWSDICDFLNTITSMPLDKDVVFNSGMFLNLFVYWRSNFKCKDRVNWSQIMKCVPFFIFRDLKLA